MRELPEVMRSASREKIRAALDEGIYWAAFYELPFAQHVALGLYLLGQKDKLLEMASAQDPQEEVLRWVESGAADGPDPTEETIGGYVAVLVSFQRSVLSIMLYQRSMSKLIEEAREGDDEALFKAVRIDRSAIACPTIAARIAKAEVLGEKRFFERLRSALKGPSKKHWEAYSDLRYSLAVLREFGLDSLSDAELERLLVDVLKVYPKTWSARKNLRKQYYESRKIKGL